MFLILFEAAHYCEHKIPVQILFSSCSATAAVAAQINFPANYLPPAFVWPVSCALYVKPFSGPFWSLCVTGRSSPIYSFLIQLKRSCDAWLSWWRSVILTHLGYKVGEGRRKTLGHDTSGGFFSLTKKKKTRGWRNVGIFVIHEHFQCSMYSYF